MVLESLSGLISVLFEVFECGFAFFLTGTSIQFCLNFRVILYLMLPGFFLKIASRDRWLGIYSTLLPHFVCLAWWQAAVTASNGKYV